MIDAIEPATPVQPLLGWRRDREDFGHLQLTKTPFPKRRRVESSLPFDPRTAIRIHNRCHAASSCSDALATCLELLHFLKTRGRTVRLSRMFSYLAAQKMEGLIGEDVGATVSSIVKAAKVFGICRERVFRTGQTYVDGFPVAAVSDAAAYRVVSHSVLRSYDDVYQYLARGLGAVLLAADWTQSLQETSGRIENVYGETYGRHAVAVVGYSADTLDDRGRRYLIVANSHGRNWGERGFALVAPHLFDAWGSDATALIVGLSDLAEYRPRKFDWLHPSLEQPCTSECRC